MRKLCAIVAAVLAGAAAWAQTPTLRSPVEPFRSHATPVAAPPLAFADGEGRPLTLASFRGRVVLLNLWATWCPPCVAEMPALDRLQAALGSENFEVVAVSIDRTGRQVVEPFLRRLNVGNLRLYFDQSGASPRLLQVPGLPTTVLFDREGREIGRMAGAAEWDSPAAQAIIRAALARPGPAPQAAPAAQPAPPAQPATQAGPAPQPGPSAVQPQRAPTLPAPTLQLDEFPDEERRPAPNDGGRA